MASEYFQLFLPLIRRDHEAIRGFGAQMDNPMSIPVAPNRLYQTPARWAALDDWVATNVEAVKGNGNLLIMNTRTCPAEYRKYSEYMGSPPLPKYYEKYAEFLVGLVKDFDPYAIEIWNEPGVPITIDNGLQWWFGAWVEDENYYGAGVEYGNLLKYVYPILNGLGVKVLGGSLVNTGWQQVQFLDGIMDTAPTSMDYVSWHNYLYINDPYDIVYDREADIRAHTDLPQVVTETAVISGADGVEFDTAVLRERQVGYINWMRDRQGQIPPWLWYCTNNTWRNCGLQRLGELTPAYYAWSA